MRKFVQVASIIYIVIFSGGRAWADPPDNGDYSLRFLSANIPKQNLSFRCMKSTPKKDIVFFEAFVDDGEHLYDFFSRKPLNMESCRDMVYESKKILRKATHVVLLGQNKMPGDQEKPKDWKNDLVKRYQGKIYATSFFSQLSNGKKCQCWFEGCPCLPVIDGTKVDIIRNYQE